MILDNFRVFYTGYSKLAKNIVSESLSFGGAKCRTKCKENTQHAVICVEISANNKTHIEWKVSTCEHSILIFVYRVRFGSEKNSRLLSCQGRLLGNKGDHWRHFLRTEKRRIPTESIITLDIMNRKFIGNINNMR